MSSERLTLIYGSTEKLSNPIRELRQVWADPLSFGAASRLALHRGKSSYQSVLDDHLMQLDETSGELNEYLVANPETCYINPPLQVIRYAAAVSIIIGGEFKCPYLALTDNQGKLLDRTQDLHM